jgi:hypothetical protein
MIQKKPVDALCGDRLISGIGSQQMVAPAQLVMADLKLRLGAIIFMFRWPALGPTAL